jgi:hypothetical protein
MKKHFSYCRLKVSVEGGVDRMGGATWKLELRWCSCGVMYLK